MVVLLNCYEENLKTSSQRHHQPTCKGKRTHLFYDFTFDNVHNNTLVIWYRFFGLSHTSRSRNNFLYWSSFVPALGSFLNEYEIWYRNVILTEQLNVCASQQLMKDMKVSLSHQMSCYARLNRRKNKRLIYTTKGTIFMLNENYAI